MKKIFIAALLCVIFLLSACSSQSATNSVSSSKTVVMASAGTSGVMGNTNGNISNWGLAAMSGDWIYYTPMYDEAIYKIKTNGTQKVKLCNDRVHGLNVAGNWIYYSSASGDAIYKIKTDGTGRKKIYSGIISYIRVVGGQIYFLNSDQNICKIDTNGTSYTVLRKDYTIHFNVQGDWIYYTTLNSKIPKPNSAIICKVKTNGTGYTRIGADNAEYILVDSGWIYYVLNGNLYRINFDGTKKTQLTKANNAYSENFNIADNWIYYNTHSITLKPTDKGFDTGCYKTSTNGLNTCRLSKNDLGNINIVGSWIYYSNNESIPSNALYKMKTNGTSDQLVVARKIY